MKTLKFLTLIGLILYFSVDTIGQTTKTFYTGQETWEVYCEDALYDVITGTPTYTIIEHSSVNKYWRKIIGQNNLNEWVSLKTGEVYKEVWLNHDFRFNPASNTLFFTAIYRLDGNMGSHIICDQTWEVNADTWEIITYDHRHKCL